MDIAILSLSAFFVAILTFFSGFGLGTILAPLFMVFFPTDVAIALTGVVHLFNNLFKIMLVGRRIDRQVLFRFGLPAVIAAFFGAWLLLQLTDFKPLFSYVLGNRICEVLPDKLLISILLILFALMDLLPHFRGVEFGKDKLPLGGVLSGFFGGLSGNQGALRSAFLVRAGLSKEAFIATTVAISTCVDLSRLSVYATRFAVAGLQQNLLLVTSVTVAGIAGAYLGNKLLKKVTFRLIQTLVAVMLIIVSLALGAGII